jgi:hypothetical protein
MSYAMTAITFLPETTEALHVGSARVLDERHMR